MNDWLVYKMVDAVTRTMDIHNDIVLVEVRNFRGLIYDFILQYSDEDEILNRELTEGRYNIIMKKSEIFAYSISVLRRLLQLV